MATEWYYTSGGEERGPVTAVDIKQMAAAGALLPDDQVWNKSLTEWVPARRIKGLTFSVQEHDGQAHVPETAVATAPAPVEPVEEPFAAAPPSPMLGYESPGREGIAVTMRAIEILQKTRPWVMIMAVLMFLGVGMMLLGALAMLVLGSAVRGGAAAHFGFGVAFAYIAVAAFMVGPPIFLTRYFVQIGNLMRMRRPADLEAALEAQKSYWKYLGVATLIFIGLYIAVFAIAILARFL